MPEENLIASLHFLRPWWLLLAPLALLIHWRLRRTYNASQQWKTAIADHLLPHLLVAGSEDKRIRPYQLMTTALLLMSVALAGPAWRKEITPFTEDRAPLVVALEMTPSMLSVDQPPTRLERAKQKLRDILERRKGARTAVIVYAGSAHAVLPLTDDTGLITTYLDSLSPLIMPTEGEDPEAALDLAEEMLAGEPAVGTILFLTDGIDRTVSDRFAEHSENNADQLLFLVFGTDEGGPTEAISSGVVRIQAGLAPGTDMNGIRAVADASGAGVLRASVDSGDVDRLIRQIRRHLVNAIDADEQLRWHDAGYYLIWPMALMLMIWFRRGWTVNWQ